MIVFKRFLMDSWMGFFKAIRRFPMTVLSLAILTGMIWHIINLRQEPSVTFFKEVFILALSAVVGLAVQFVAERKAFQIKGFLISYAVGLLVVAAYAGLIWPSLDIDTLVAMRTTVAILVALCLVAIAPSAQKGQRFDEVFLVHFKAAFTAVLFALVIFLGLAAILAAIDLLLFRLAQDYMAYTASGVWLFFAPIYYSSLLPHFNSMKEEDRALVMERIDVPKFLSILISYVAIPLISAYTLVLLAYFAKILVTQVWPIGQLGPMILGYSIAGFILFLLASTLNNRFSALYQTWFPRILVPIVVVQQISVGIRLSAYGLTESRYYLMLFGIFSIVMGLWLSIKPKLDHAWIAIVLMGLALFSIVPPLDAYNLSFASQKGRLETMLTQAGLLTNGVLTPDPSADETLRRETTSILDYMNQRHSLKDLAWLSEDFTYPQDFKAAFGFDTTYANAWEGQTYFYAGLEPNPVVDISGFDQFVRVNLYRQMDASLKTDFDFMINQSAYHLSFDRIDQDEVIVRLTDGQNNVLIETGLVAFVEGLKQQTSSNKDQMPVERMTYDVEKNGVRLRIVFQFVNSTTGSSDAGSDYDLFVMVDVPNE